MSGNLNPVTKGSDIYILQLLNFLNEQSYILDG